MNVLFPILTATMGLFIMLSGQSYAVCNDDTFSKTDTERSSSIPFDDDDSEEGGLVSDVASDNEYTYNNDAGLEKVLLDDDPSSNIFGRIFNFGAMASETEGKNDDTNSNVDTENENSNKTDNDLNNIENEESNEIKSCAECIGQNMANQNLIRLAQLIATNIPGCGTKTIYLNR